MDPAALMAATKPIIERVASAAAGPLRDRLLKAANQLDLYDLGKRLDSFTRVRTIWTRSESVSLYDFYYPARLTFDRTAAPMSLLTSKQNTVVCGVVGQGKSIFLRHLFAEAVAQLGEFGKLPLFAELRKLGAHRTLKSLICDSAFDLGLRMDEQLLEHYLDQSALVLILDGFDEIPSDSLSSAVDDLTRLAQRYPGVRIVVSSRPHAHFGGLNFVVRHLAPLNDYDIEPFVRQICHDEQAVASVLDAVQSSNCKLGIPELLSTPLLLSLFALVVTSFGRAPTSRADFYDNLFDLYYQRHDSTKPGFVRAHSLQIGYTQSLTAFDAFSFEARRHNYRSFGRRQFDQCVDWASGHTGLQIDSEEFRNEFLRVTPLLQEDGLELVFLHKSIAEYHCARYIAGLPDAVAQRFYEQVDVRGLETNFLVELDFLEEIDNRRFTEFYLLPQMHTVWRPLFRSVGMDDFERLDRLSEILIDTFGPPLSWGSDLGSVHKLKKNDLIFHELQSAQAACQAGQEHARAAVNSMLSKHGSSSSSPPTTMDYLSNDVIRKYMHTIALTLASAALKRIDALVARVEHSRRHDDLFRVP